MADHSEAFTETQVIARLREIFASPDPRIEVGIGDDAAVVAGDLRQVMTTDMAVEGVHFRTDWSTALEIGRKVTAANAADILAMGGDPDYLLVAVALTGSESMEWISDLARGIKFEADLAGLQIIGGDISSSEKVIISMTAVGHCAKPILRSGAKPGDGIYLSSLTGWSAAGLAILKSKAPATTDVMEKALKEFKSPTIDYGFDSSKATAMCDISDSIIEQASQVAAASKVQLHFDEKLLAKAEEFNSLQSLAAELKIDIWQLIFGGGEDHVLFATGADLPGVRIGEVLSGSGLSGIPAIESDRVWSHFR
jgi:thiamine-monophosphate kinase